MFRPQQQTFVSPPTNNNSPNANTRTQSYISSPQMKKKRTVRISQFDSIFDTKLVPTESSTGRKYSDTEIYNAACNKLITIEIEGTTAFNRNYWDPATTSVELIHVLNDKCRSSMHIYLLICI